MPRILITGMSGTGKSTVIAALRSLGHQAIDSDDGWCRFSPDGEWVWDEALVDELLSTEHVPVLFFAGCASNQGRFRQRFDHVVLLSAPLDVMISRIQERTTNPFGKQPDEFARILADHAEIEPLLRAACTLEIDTARPLPSVVDELLRLVTDRVRPLPPSE